MGVNAMKRVTRVALGAVLFGLALSAPAAETDLEELRNEIELLKRAYERRIETLEIKLEEMQKAEAQRQEAEAVKAAAAPPPAMPKTEAITSGTAFNPQISPILDGNYYNDDIDGKGAELLGEAFTTVGGHGHEEEDPDEEGHDHGVAERGFNIREVEIAFSGTIDPYFDVTTYLAVSQEGDVELEEAYFNTRSLPAGLRLKGGKFRSDVGYINRQHPHQWDFVDQNLPYLNLLGFDGLNDVGGQLTWLPKLPVYTLFGVEALQGTRQEERFFGAFVEDDEERAELNLSKPDGPRIYSAFAKVAPNLGLNNALQLGLSYSRANQASQVGEDEDTGAELGLEGPANLLIGDLVYKYDGAGSYGRGDFTLQSEYLYQRNDFEVRGVSDPVADAEIGSKHKATTDGAYIQGTYGFLPRWQAGLRYDVLGLTNKVTNGDSESFGDSDRWTAAVTWSPSEFSRFRLQWSRADMLNPGEGEELVRNKFDTVYLQFLLSLGTHGAHYF